MSPSISAVPLEQAVWAALEDVSDPEIPTVSLIDLGVVQRIHVAEGTIAVDLLPTFIGCPAVEMMRQAVEERLRGFAPDVEARVSFAEAWTSDRITERGRERLRASGFAPPAPSAEADRVLPLLPIASCPYCGSLDTTIENAFGPTLCRAIHHCAACQQPFERFKTV